MTTETRHSGRVLFYIATEAFGFIKPATGRNIYFNRAEMLRTGFVLDKGDAVEFSLAPGKQGRPHAADILLKARAAESVTPAEIEARQYAEWCMRRKETVDE